ncbi:MAG: translation elongation factor Ts [Synergistaceae bacterium]|nr:translation elongation factor Ts [Synergistaceae bacterium]MBQ6740625.1 translation elongation factor Ts [Synergistaceae bacterium]MBQ6910372.1 translation elongation factor Ts [Synergistaceae bacterium]MBQ7569664.1 translation elongation factor Ts [Synergistaceae bacterium]MBR0095563.1 translation elongation factor Ts [Synergistaceae bacterium]
MAEITAAIVKELRERTGSGMMDCKKALAETNGDMEKAIDYLREKGLAKAAKKAERTASDGRIFTYIHSNAKIGAMVEINSETDFVAKTDEFNELGHEVAMQIAAANPLYLVPEEVPEEVLNRERDVYRQQLIDEGKPADRLDKIIEGKLRKYYETNCLLEQEYIRDADKKIKDLVTSLIAKLGENIVIKRFARFAIGE